MRKVWILVANSGLSKIYRAENANHLEEIKTFEHLESHLKAEDLVSDSQGRAMQRGVYGSDTFDKQTSQKVKEAVTFAEEISHYLDQCFKKGDFERLYIICKPPFLGHLRQTLSSHVSKIVATEIHKDLTSMTTTEIREYLPPVL